MKSGPTLKAWTVSPRRRRASSSASVTVVLPTPLDTPPTTRRRPAAVVVALIPGPPARTGSGGARPGRSPGFRILLLPAPSRLIASGLAVAGFVPGYSDAVAADSHRLPWAPRAHLGAFDGRRLTEPDAANKCHP